MAVSPVAVVWTSVGLVLAVMIVLVLHLFLKRRNRNLLTAPFLKDEFPAVANLVSVSVGILALFVSAITYNTTIEANRQAAVDSKMSSADEATAAANERALLGQMVGNLTDASKLLGQNAEASTKASRILEAQRAEQVLRPIPAIQVYAFNIDGTNTLIGKWERGKLVPITIKAPWRARSGQRNFGLQVLITNDSDAILQYGTVRIRCDALDGLENPLIADEGVLDAKDAAEQSEDTQLAAIRQALLSDQKLVADGIIDGTANNLSVAAMTNTKKLFRSMANLTAVTNEYSQNIQMLPKVARHPEVGFTYKLEIRPERPHGEKERRFRIGVVLWSVSESAYLPIDVVLQLND